jgi:hypothetical protein
MILKGILRLTLFSFGLAGITTQLHAQAPATTFEELRDSLKLTDKESVEITDDTGFKYKARVIAITDRAITVTAKGVQRNLTAAQVKEIRHEKPDGLGNGLGFGALAGAGIAAITVGTTCENDGECAAIASLLFFPTFTAAGAGLGALFDSFTHKHETVYANSAASASRGLRIAPIVGKKTAGVNVSFKF